jgi:hypothetical protein
MIDKSQIEIGAKFILPKLDYQCEDVVEVQSEREGTFYLKVLNRDFPDSPSGTADQLLNQLNQWGAQCMI